MSYFESRIKVNFKNFDDVKFRIKFCEKLGINNIILEPKDNIERIPSSLKKNLRENSRINIFFRNNLKLNNIEDFKRRIKKYSNFSDIVSVESLNREVQLHSARDSRVDIVSFSDPEIIKTLTPGVISLTKQNSTFIEFSLASIMVRNKRIQSKNFRNLYKFTQLALKLKANFVISGNFINLFDYRHPRALVAVCHSLLGIPMNFAKKAFIQNPKKLVEKTQKLFEIKFKQGVKLI